MAGFSGFAGCFIISFLVYALRGLVFVVYLEGVHLLYGRYFEVSLDYHSLTEV